MKIENSIISEFLDKMSFGGITEEATLNFKEDGLECNMFDKANVCRVAIKVDKTIFKDYKPIGLIGIRDMVSLRNNIKTLGKIVSISSKGGFLFLTEGSKKRILKQADASYIEYKPINATFKNSLKVEKAFLDAIKKNCDLYKEDIEVEFLVKEGKLYVTANDDTDKATECIQAMNCTDSTSVFKKSLISRIFPSLGDGEITISFDTGVPMKIEENSIEGKMKTEFIISPIVEKDEAEKNNDIDKTGEEGEE